jgi:hypothetical protein
MIKSATVRSLILAAGLAAAAPLASASDVSLSPFVGLQYGGGFDYAFGSHVSIGPGLEYGGLLDVGGDHWGVNFLYTREQGDLEGVPLVEMKVERYLAGVREMKGEGRSRYSGVFLLGATRFDTNGFGGSTRFTIGLGLGLYTELAPHLGFRADVHGYYAFVEAGGGMACANGTCLFNFTSSGMLQGDLTAGLVLKF